MIHAHRPCLPMQNFASMCTCKALHAKTLCRHFKASSLALVQGGALHQTNSPPPYWGPIPATSLDCKISTFCPFHPDHPRQKTIFPPPSHTLGYDRHILIFLPCTMHPCSSLAHSCIEPLLKSSLLAIYPPSHSGMPFLKKTDSSPLHPKSLP